MTSRIKGRVISKGISETNAQTLERLQHDFYLHEFRKTVG